MSRLIATVFGAGYLRPAPGTWGSLVALPLLWLLHITGGFPLVLAATVLVCLVGWWATARALDGMAAKDPSEIVIDEVAGQWIALLPVSFGAAMMGADILALWPGWISAFILFRLFDITKPGPVGWADRRDGALGVMLDDIIAGLLAAFGVAALAAIAHGVLM